MKNSFRIVADNYAGYEVQIKYWWFPFKWFQKWSESDTPINTFITIDAAKDWINSGCERNTPKRKRKVVWGPSK
jgi:hypothetical protein